MFGELSGITLEVYLSPKRLQLQFNDKKIKLQGEGAGLAYLTMINLRGGRPITPILIGLTEIGAERKNINYPKMDFYVWGDGQD